MKMNKQLVLATSPRHGFKVARVPACYNMFVNAAMHYSEILDTVYEMADILATSNGLSYTAAIQQAITDERYTVLSHDKAAILTKLKA
jgi:hypothetical protein